MERVLREGAFLGETHIVTGAAHGIGHAVAMILAAHGTQVALVDLYPERLADPRISGYTTGQVVQANGGMYPA
jgi:NADP-dependent 3-hydroxy acid dehydrogenase YdfG